MIRSRVRRMETLLSRLAAVLRGRTAPCRRRLQTAGDVIDLLEEQVEALRAESCAGTVEKARAIGYLAGIARKAIETGDLAARLEILEAVLKQRKKNNPR
jgi:hypothetical protein